jgi:type VI secretion system protein ImpF
MARIDNEIRVTPSILDRLLDYEPAESREAPKSRSNSVRDLRQAVRRDLEWLLNTRSLLHPEDGGLEEARKSVAFFGLPDFTGMTAQSAAAQKHLVETIETAIRNFEPRFLNVKVILEPLDILDRQLKFRIEARLDVEPAPEPIAFDSVLQIGNGGFAISER